MTLKNITFYTQSGGSQTLKVQDYDVTTDLEDWGRPDKALDGTLRHNIRGIRRSYRIQYRRCLEPDTYRSVFNNIASDLDGGSSFTISEGTDLSNARVVVPAGTFANRIEYGKTIGGYVPDIDVMEAEIVTTTFGSYVESGYVDVGYVQ